MTFHQEDVERPWDRPLQWFVKDRGSRSAHILDYETAAGDTALCGKLFAEIAWQGGDRPRAVCLGCQNRLGAHEAGEWQRRALHEFERYREAELEAAELTARLKTANKLILDLEEQADSVMPTSDTPLHWYVRDAGSRAAHHLDYTRKTFDHALCGRAFGDILWEGEGRPRAVCRECQARLDGHEKKWWRCVATAEGRRRKAIEDPYELMKEEQKGLKQKIAHQRRELEKLQAWATRTKKARSHASPTARQVPKGRRGTQSGSVPRLPRSGSSLPKNYRIPTITVVSGGLPGQGKASVMLGLEPVLGRG